MICCLMQWIFILKWKFTLRTFSCTILSQDNSKKSQTDHKAYERRVILNNNSNIETFH